MNRTPETSLAQINQAINRLRPVIQQLQEFSDPQAVQELVLGILRHTYTLEEMYGPSLRDLKPPVLAAEQHLLDEYNDYKRLTLQCHEGGVLPISPGIFEQFLWSSRQMDEVYGTPQQPSAQQDLATDFSLGVANLGGNFATIYALYFFQETVVATRQRSLSPAEMANDQGYALAQRGAYAEALRYHRQAIELSPAFHLAWINAGIALKNLGRYHDAIECYDFVLTNIDPNYKKAWHNKAVALSLLGANEQALECCRAALKIDPTYDVAIRLRSELEAALQTNHSEPGPDALFLGMEPELARQLAALMKEQGLTAMWLGDSDGLVDEEDE